MEPAVGRLDDFTAGAFTNEAWESQWSQSGSAGRHGGPAEPWDAAVLAALMISRMTWPWIAFADRDPVAAMEPAEAWLDDDVPLALFNFEVVAAMEPAKDRLDDFHGDAHPPDGGQTAMEPAGDRLDDRWL